MKYKKIILPNKLLESITKLNSEYFEFNLDLLINLIREDKNLNGRIVKMMEDSLDKIPFFFRGMVRDKIKDFLSK